MENMSKLLSFLGININNGRVLILINILSKMLIKNLQILNIMNGKLINILKFVNTHGIHGIS